MSTDAATPTKSQARLIVRLSSSLTKALLDVAKNADAIYLDAVHHAASNAELLLLAQAGLEAAEHVHSNMETIMQASVVAEHSRWRSREKTERRIATALRPHVDTAARAVAEWQGRVARHEA